MVTRYGMTGEDVGQVVYRERPSAFLGQVAMGPQPRGEYSEATAREIDLAVRRLVDDAFATATETLKKRRKDLEAGVKLLLEKEVLTADEFPALKPASPPPETKAAE
jgi:cell division protease FtsH